MTLLCLGPVSHNMVLWVWFKPIDLNPFCRKTRHFSKKREAIFFCCPDGDSKFVSFCVPHFAVKPSQIHSLVN